MCIPSQDLIEIKVYIVNRIVVLDVAVDFLKCFLGFVLSSTPPTPPPPPKLQLTDV